MQIRDSVVNPGENLTIKIPVASLPSGTEINLHAHVFRSKNPGPTMLVIGGLHGDEVNGIEIVRRAVGQKVFSKLKCGAVIAVPLLNVYGFINFSRGFPDGKDVNRSFPGTKSGSLASRIAYTFTREILPLADFALDFHTGGNSVYNYPQARFSSASPESEQLALDLNMPFTIASSLIPKSLRKTASNKGIPMVVFEGGESLRIDEYSVKEGLRGIKNVMKQRGMVDSNHEIIETTMIDERAWVRANRAGIFNLAKKSGDFVNKGEILGKITDPYNTYRTKVVAKSSGYIFGHNNNPVVNKGDALFHIGNTKT